MWFSPADGRRSSPRDTKVRSGGGGGGCGDWLVLMGVYNGTKCDDLETEVKFKWIHKIYGTIFIFSVFARLCRTPRQPKTPTISV